MGGMRMSLTMEVTTFPKATPIMIPMAISNTFPRVANSLNSFSVVVSPRFNLSECNSADSESLHDFRSRVKSFCGLRQLSQDRRPFQLDEARDAMIWEERTRLRGENCCEGERP